MNPVNTRAARRSVASAVVAILALSAAACGSGGGSGVAATTVPAGRWANTLCSSLERYGKATKRPFLVFQACTWSSRTACRDARADKATNGAGLDLSCGGSGGGQ